jgi:hypothetical protein
MSAGGIPDGLFYHVLLLYFCRGTGHRVHFRTILEKYTTPEQYDFIRKSQRSDFCGFLDALFHSSDFDRTAAAKAGFQLFDLSDEQRTNPVGVSFYGHLHCVLKQCFSAGGEPARVACQTQSQGDTLNILFADNSYFANLKLPSEVLEFAHIERIVCAQQVITEIPGNRQLLGKMNNLKELVLYHYRPVRTHDSKRYLDRMQEMLVVSKKSLPHVNFTLRQF